MFRTEKFRKIVNKWKNNPEALELMVDEIFEKMPENERVAVLINLTFTTFIDGSRMSIIHGLFNQMSIDSQMEMVRQLSGSLAQTIQFEKNKKANE